MKIDVRLTSPVLTARSDVFARAVRLLGEACIYVNREHIAAYGAPPLYSSGVVYQNEPVGRPDELLSIPDILERGWGDCLHLSCWRIAELREAGEERAQLAYTWKPMVINGQPGRLFHCIVRRANGAIEDPSLVLGM
jgi:hypothetical protein